MSIGKTLSSYLVAFTGLAGLVLSAYAFSAELSHYTASTDSESDNIGAFISGARQPGLASATQMAFMLDCRTAISSPTGVALPQAQRTALYQSCFNGAQAVTRVNPAWSFAWYSAAFGALALNDDAGMNTDLAQSYSTGKTEGWVAVLRAELVEFYFSQVAPALLPLHDQDLALLLNGNNVAFLAALYVTQPASQERITKVVEAASPLLQRQFIGRVKNQLNGQVAK